MPMVQRNRRKTVISIQTLSAIAMITSSIVLAIIIQSLHSLHKRVDKLEAKQQPASTPPERSQHSDHE